MFLNSPLPRRCDIPEIPDRVWGLRPIGFSTGKVDRCSKAYPDRSESRENSQIQASRSHLNSCFFRFCHRQRGNDMESFSWSDSLRALTASCLACLRTSKSERNNLDDLLVDSSSATTTDAETLSLHSNPGALAQRRRHSRFGKSIRLFGWDLFGRRQPIRLPDDDEEEAEGEGEEGQRGQAQQQGEARKKKGRRPPPPAISSSTLDSDAAPLDSAAIVSHATKHAEEEEARAARHARRRERKERKQAALALALEHAAVLNGDGEFEGFPGSGERRSTTDPSLSIDERDSTDAGMPPLRHVPYQDDDDDDDEDDEEGDFGAGAYARRTPGSSDSGRRSDSRSRTSTSLSGARSAHAAQPYNHHYISQQPSARPTAQATQPPPPPARRPSKNKSSRSSSSSKRTRSSPSASQSPSIASPVAPQFSDASVAPVPPPSPFASAVPRAGQEFGGLKNAPGPLHTAGIERLSSGFPSPGLGGPRNGKRDMGAFLANRGHD